MSGTDLRDVVAIGPPKEASLYFDRVLPFDTAAGYFADPSDPDLDLNIPHYGGKFSGEVVESLLPGCADANDVYIKITAAGFAAKLLASAHRNTDFDEFLKQVPGSPLESIITSCGINIFELAARLSDGTLDVKGAIDTISDCGIIPQVRILGFSNSAIWTTQQPELLPEGSEAERYIATLRNLHVPDVTTIPWNHIVEFRKDTESRKALRDLRLFFSENFEGKDPGFIADKIEQLAEQHDKATKLWGFNTRLSAMSVLLTKEGLVGAGAGAALATYAGLSPAMAAGIAAAASVGNIALEVTKVFVDSKRMAIDRPVRYLAAMNNKLVK